MYVLYYASMLRCWQLIWILVRTDHPCLGVGCHMAIQKEQINSWRCSSGAMFMTPTKWKT
jgi:hypothetical protein